MPLLVDLPLRVAALPSDIFLSHDASGAAEYKYTLDQIRPWIDVRDHGATGDGSTDDSAAIQAALEVVPAAGGMIVVPPGVYKAKDLVYEGAGPLTIMGLAAGASAISTSGAVFLLPSAGPVLTLGRSDVTNHYGVRLSNLVFNGGDLANAVAVKTLRRNFCLFENISANLFSGANSIGFEFDGTGDATVTNTLLHCKARACATAVKAQASTGLNLISGFYFNGGIGVDHVSGDTLCCQDVNFDAFTDVAVQVDTVGARIMAGRFEANQLAIRLKGGADRASVIGNFMIGFGAGTTGGVEILSGASDGMLAGNNYSNMGDGFKVSNAGTNMSILDEPQFRVDFATGRITAGRQFEGSLQAKSEAGFAYVLLDSVGAGGKQWRLRSRTDGYCDFRNETNLISGLAITPDGNPQLRTFTVAALPSAAGNPRGLIYVSDEAGGATVAFSDGSSWRRLQDRAVVS